MKGTGKRIISILLSALMVITMIPSFAFTAFAEDSAVTALRSAMTAYENKMSSGTIYKNLANAYDAYLAANKGLDSYLYGGSHNTVTSSNLSTLTTNLTNATNAMTAWTQQGARVTTKHGIFAGDTTSGNEAYPSTDGGSPGYYASAVHNLLYVQTGLQMTGTYCQAYSATGTGTLVKRELYYPQATMLYADDSSDPTIPILLRLYSSDTSKTRWALTAFQNAEQTKWSLTMKSGGYYKWFGGDKSMDYAWKYHYGAGQKLFNATGDNNSSYSSSHTLQTSKSGWGSKKDDQTYVNYITYIGSMTDDVAYDEITPSFMVYAHDSNTYFTTDGLSGTLKGGEGNNNGFDGKIHIINYARLIHKINSYSGSAFGVNIKNYLQNRKNGSNRSVSDFFTAFDAMTSYDLHSYFASSNNWNGCQSAMTTVINGMNNQSITADVDGYQALRNAIDYEGIIANLGDNTSHRVKDMAAIANGEDTYTNFNTFVSAYDVATSHMAALALSNGSYSTDSTASTLASNLIDAFNNLGIKGAEAPTITGDSFISKDATVNITNNDNNGAVVHYTISYDGEAEPSVSGTLSSTSENICVFGNSDEYGTALVSAWAAAANSDLTSSIEYLSCVNRDYAADTLVYQESFDGARIDGTDFLTGNTNGKSGIIANSGTVHVENAAGGDYDKRANVLKIDSATAASRGNYVQLANPLASSINRAYAKDRGVTISFWRHMNADCAAWLNAVNFTSYDSENAENRYKYATLTASGRLTFVQRDNNGGNAENGGWMDYFPYDNDITNHSASVNTGFWTNIVLTVDAKATTVGEAFKIYINGVPHDVRSTDLAEIVRSKGGDYSSMSDTAVISAFLDFITDSSTHFDFGYGGYDEGDKSLDMWLDDVRIYTKPLTQVEINNMYTDEFTDAKKAGVDYKSSTSHDPTNVTVYTLGEAVTTDSNGVKPAGSKVGQEFIDYYGVDPATCSVEYYSFGTGLTVYHSYDNLNWTCIGDSQGRFAYQNQELFVSASGQAQPYYTTLATPLAHAAQGQSINGSEVREGAAGKLVWAPHVCYNLTTDEWMYYGSTSAWNSNYSTVFLLTSDYVDHGYKYQQMIVKTSAGQSTNAIDSCVYYGHNADGSIDKSKLYCLYGSWGDIMVKTLAANGRRADGEDDLGTLLSVAHGGGEGGYMTYENGYYYYFITPEANGWAQAGGNYHLRVFRSENPTSGFVSVAGTAANTTADPHGNAMLTAYDNSTVDYKYTSTGHTSFYEAYNSYGEKIYINAAHTREYSHDSKPVEDGALATRQIWLIGNVAIQNSVAFTTDGWPVAFPKLYDDSFSLHNKGANSASRNYFTAYDIDGVYASNQTTTNGVVSNEEVYKIFAINSKSGVIVDENTITTHTFYLEHTDNQTYIHLKNNDGSDFAEGVIANQGTNGEAVPMFSFLIEDGASEAYHVWGVKNGENPTTEEIQEALEAPISTYTTVNGAAYYKGNVATNGYNKVAYCSTTTEESGELNKFYELMHVYLPTKAVIVYDGDNTNRPSVPAVFSNKAGNSSNQYIKYVSSTTSNLAFAQNWSGNTTNASEWPGDAMQTNYFGYDSDHQLNSEGSLNDTSSTRYWWNKLYYTGSGNTSNYYEVFTNPTFKAAGHSTSIGVGDQDGNIDNLSSTIYVINYNPILDILNGTTHFTGKNYGYTDVYEDVLANKYTPYSTMQFFRAMELVMGVNPTNPKYDYASNTEAAIQQFVGDMQQALAVFSIIDLQKKAEFSALDSAYEAADAILMSLNMNGDAQSMYTASSVNAIVTALDNAKATYSLDSEERDEVTESQQSTINSLADAINTAVENLEETPAVEVDLSAYQEVIQTANNVDQDAFDVTQAEIDALVAYYTETINDTVTYEGSSGDSTITVVSDDVTPENIDTIAKTIIEYLNDRLKMYDVEVEGESIIPSYNITGRNETVVENQGTEDEYTYTRATMNSVANFESSDENTAWYMEYESATAHRTKQFQGYGKEFSTKVLGNLKVWAVNAETAEGKTNKLSVIRSYSNKPDKHPVQMIDFVGSSYTLPDAPEILGYSFDGYQIVSGYDDGVTLDGNELSGIDGEIQIEAIYTLTSEDNFNVTVYSTAANSNLADPYNMENTFNYNDNISVTDENAFGWVEKVGETYRPYYIGSTLNFFVSEATEIKAVTTAQEFYSYGSTPAININKSNARNISGTKNKTYFNGQIVPSENANVQIIEYGFVIGMEKTTDALNEDLVILENIVNNENYRVIRAKSTKDLVGANQFAIAVNGLTNKIIYKGYIIYQDSNGLIKTVYTNPVSMNL